MAKDPAFLFYPGDYLRDTQCLSEGAQVAYDRIMCEHMRNICITQQQLKFFTKRLSDDEREELLMVIEETKDGFQIPWVVESIVKRRAYSESRRNNRLKPKKKPTKHINNISKTYDHHMENENEIENVIKNGVEKKQRLEDFENWWNLYDKKTGKKAALAKWSRLKADQIQKCMDVVEAYVRFTPDSTYRKAPIKYLNGEYWEDDLTLAISKENPGKLKGFKLNLK